MDVYFLRHGLADVPDWDPAHDDERPLTDEGVLKMKAEARCLRMLNLKLDLVLTSPLARARQTAEIVARRLDVELVEEPALAPGFDAAAAAQIVVRYPAARAIMLVGHEPDFSTTVSALIGGARVSLKKGGLARVRVELTDSTALSGTLLWLLPPRVLQIA